MFLVAKRDVRLVGGLRPGSPGVGGWGGVSNFAGSKGVQTPNRVPVVEKNETGRSWVKKPRRPTTVGVQPRNFGRGAEVQTLKVNWTFHPSKRDSKVTGNRLLCRFPNCVPKKVGTAQNGSLQIFEDHCFFECIALKGLQPGTAAIGQAETIHDGIDGNRGTGTQRLNGGCRTCAQPSTKTNPGDRIIIWGGKLGHTK